MLAYFLVGAFLAFLAFVSVISGLSCFVARDFWWRLYNKLSWSALVGKTTSIPAHRPLWWEINSIAGGLVQILFGVGLICYLLLALLRH